MPMPMPPNSNFDAVRETVKTRLGAISLESGYNTDAGARVYLWEEKPEIIYDPAQPTQSDTLPIISIADAEIVVNSRSLGTDTPRANFECDQLIAVKGFAATAPAAQQLRDDILYALSLEQPTLESNSLRPESISGIAKEPEQVIFSVTVTYRVAVNQTFGHDAEV